MATTNKSNVVITVLVLVVVVLAAIVLYTLVVKPKLSGYVVAKQNEGVQIAVNSILLQLQQNGFVQIPLSENQTLYLAAFDPTQLQGAQQQTEQPATTQDTTQPAQ